MKKLILAFTFCCMAEMSVAQYCGEPVFSAVSLNTNCRGSNSAPALNFSFYFKPQFNRSALLPAKPLPAFVQSGSIIYADFRAMQYRFPEGAVFCRMENACTKRFGFMLSIHAGGYSER
ncbi:hypothetical protein BH11BAC7_BH11BAC7_09370 [soil metagenome]